eukprot:scaffold12806_cov104-Isochrysis_galbana.AAC.7
MPTRDGMRGLRCCEGRGNKKSRPWRFTGRNCRRPSGRICGSEYRSRASVQSLHPTPTLFAVCVGMSAVRTVRCRSAAMNSQ